MFLIRFLHLTIFGFTAMLPLLGVGTVAPRSQLNELVWLLLIGLAFHIFAYLLNDVVDLPIDRTQPARANYPLVQGSVSPKQALGLALAQIPIAFGLLWWREASAKAFFWLLVAFVCLAIYDLWGKKTAVPPLTDLIQGIGWAALIMVGTNGESTTLTWLLFAYVTVYILLINGVNASLRDLANDWRNGVLTTAVWLGALPQENGQLLIPQKLRHYAFFWQAILAMIGVLLVLNLPIADGWWGLTAVLLTLLAAFYLIHRMTQTTTQSPLSQPFYMLHIMLLLILLILLFTRYTPAPLNWVLPLSFFAPLLTADWLVSQYSAMTY